MKLNIGELDELVVFLREQAENLEKLEQQRRYRWAGVGAKKMRRIASILLQVRQEQVGVSGERVG